MPQTAQGTISHVKGTTISSGSRGMARPNVHEVQSFLEEYDELLQEMRTIQGELSGFKNYCLQEQRRIRANGSDSRTLRAWIDRKAELEADRKRLVDRLTEATNRANQIKPLALEQKQKIAAKTNTELQNSEKLTIWKEILSELQAIRRVLEAKTNS